MDREQQKYQHDRVVTHTLLMRLAQKRIPMLNAIKKELKGGAPISDYHLRYLANMMEDCQRNMHYMEAYPELQPTMNRVVSLYHEVVELVMECESNSRKRSLTPP